MNLALDEVSGNLIEEYGFHEKLRQGNLAELFFVCLFDGKIKTDSSRGRIADLRIVNTDSNFDHKSIELKTDFYISNSVFMERFNKTWHHKFGRWMKLKEPVSGGVWRAVEKGNDLMAYFLPQYRTIAFYNSIKLKNTIEHLIESADLKSILIKSHSHQGEGYLLPRNWLLRESLFRFDLTNEEFQQKYGLKIVSRDTGSFYTVGGNTFHFPTTRKINDHKWKPYH